jgi:hypothetical protein
MMLVVAAGLLLALAAGVVALRRRRRQTMSHAVRSAVLTELQRDPALTGLRLRLVTRAPWSGPIVVQVAGVVSSPWYRYAVLRAAQRALARTFRSTRLDDRIVVDARNAGAVPKRRSA